MIVPRGDGYGHIAVFIKVGVVLAVNSSAWLAGLSVCHIGTGYLKKEISAGRVIMLTLRTGHM